MSPTPSAARFALRLLPAVLLGAGLLLSAVGSATAAEAGPRVDILELKGVLDRPLAAFVEEIIAEAGAAQSQLVVINLDSPGAVGSAAQDIAEVIDASSVPVAVWAGPAGASATGGAYLVFSAAHLSGVSPGVVVGAASPLDLADPGAEREALAGLLRTYAEARGRDVALVDEVVDGAALAVLPAGEQLGDDAALPPGVDPGAVRGIDERALDGVADVVALSLPDFLRELDRRDVMIGGGVRTLDLDPSAAAVRYHSPGLVRRALHAVTDPTLAYLLVIAGALVLGFEAFQPGFGVAGFSGIPLLVLGLYGLWSLPTNWFGVLLLGAGMVLLAVDLARGGLGLLTLGGAGGVAAGSILLFGGPAPMEIANWLIWLVVAASLVFFVVVMTTVLRAQGQQLPAPPSALKGQVGVVRSVLNPEGHVFVDGALWRARAPEDVAKVRTGTKVRVTDVAENATLHVELVPDETPHIR